MQSQRPLGEWTGDANDLLTRITWTATLLQESGGTDTFRITPTPQPGYFWITSGNFQREQKEAHSKPKDERLHLAKPQLLFRPGDSFRVMADYPLKRGDTFPTMCHVTNAIKDSSRGHLGRYKLEFPDLTQGQRALLKAQAIPDWDPRFAHGPPGAVGVRREGHSQRYMEGQIAHTSSTSTVLHHFWSVRDPMRSHGGTVDVDEDATADRIMDQRSIWNPQEQRRQERRAAAAGGEGSAAAEFSRQQLKDMGFKAADRRRLARFYPL